MTFGELYLNNPEFHEWYYRLLQHLPTNKVLLLEGPNGSGKSYLVDEIKEDLDTQGLTTIISPILDTKEALYSKFDLIVVDNISQATLDKLPYDAIFTSISHGQVTTRKLYTEDEQVTWYLKAAMIITTSRRLKLRSDLERRLIRITLPKYVQV